MLARKEAKASGEYQVNEFVYVDYNGKFTDLIEKKVKIEVFDDTDN